MKVMKLFCVMAVLLSVVAANAARFEPIRLTRSDWNARQPRAGEMSQDHQAKTQFMIGHQGTTSHSLGANADKVVARSIQEAHMNPPNRFADIGYHVMVGRNGTILEGRDLGAEPVCNQDHNSGAVCLAFLGCFDRSCGPNEVTDNMIFAMGRIIGELAHQLRIPYVGRHNIRGMSEIGNRYPASPGNLIMERNRTGHVQIDVIAELARKELERIRSNGHDDL